MSLPLVWPPRLNDPQLELLISNIKDWQLTRGCLLKHFDPNEQPFANASTIGVTLFPTLFPYELFRDALTLQPIFNQLYAAISDDVDWLCETLKDLILNDRLAFALWEVHKALDMQDIGQELTLGIFRSDYMLHQNKDFPSEPLLLKQVKFNTMSCAGAIYSDRTVDLHYYLQQRGTYQGLSLQKTEETPEFEYKYSQKKVLETIVLSLQKAFVAYTSSIPANIREGTNVCVLMVVQPNNANIADERPIEFVLWNRGVPTFRIDWGPDILAHCSRSQTSELIYHPPTLPQPFQVAVVYYRAGFEAKDYQGVSGIRYRFRLEKSKAIMCPSVLAHLASHKKVQQTLQVPGTLRRWLPPLEAELIERTFANMYPLDETVAGEKGRDLALRLETARNHVLKPLLAGGGPNIYGEKMVSFLEQGGILGKYPNLLQEKITPPILTNYLMAPIGIYEGSVTSELGVFGACLWTRKVKDPASRTRLHYNHAASCSFKTKFAEVEDMMGNIADGCFDSPAFVDMDVFLACLNSRGSSSIGVFQSQTPAVTFP